MSVGYAETSAQLRKIEARPNVSGRFALEKGVWHGRKVAVRWRTVTGHARRRTQHRIVYGTLDIRSGNGYQVGVVVNGETVLIHVSRDPRVYDMTRTKP